MRVYFLWNASSSDTVFNFYSFPFKNSKESKLKIWASFYSVIVKRSARLPAASYVPGSNLGTAPGEGEFLLSNSDDKNWADPS